MNYKIRMIMLTLLLSVGITQVLWVNSIGLASTGTRIIVLLSKDSSPYQEILTGFQRYLKNQGITVDYEIKNLGGDPSKSLQEVKHIKTDGADLVFTLGSPATQGAAAEITGISIIAGMILQADELKKAPNATGVFLEFSQNTQLQWMRRILPENTTVGVLFNPDINQQHIDRAKSVARNLGLQLMPRPVHTPKDLPGALDNLSNRMNVLWGIPDQVVLSPKTAQAVLLFSYRNRIPFVGLSVPWVKAGALYSLDRDYTDIGKQCGEMAEKVLNGSKVGDIPPVPPRTVRYALNLKTADHLKLDIPQALIKGAHTVFD